MKNPIKFNVMSRTNIIGMVTILFGAGKMFKPEVFNFDGDPLQLITMGMGMIYLREGIKDAVAPD